MSPALKARMLKALRITNQFVGTDMGWDEQEPSKHVVREVVPDGNCLELYGNDKEAVEAFRKLDRDTRAHVLKSAFP